MDTNENPKAEFRNPKNLTEGNEVNEGTINHG